MSEFKGTKGLWYANKEHTIYCETIEIGQCWESLNIDSPTIIEANANALLISKAPELLEMLIEIKEQIEDGRIYVTKEDIEKLIKETTEIKNR